MEHFLRNRPNESKSAASLHSETVFRPLTQADPCIAKGVESFGQAHPVQLEDIPVAVAEGHSVPKVQLLMDDGKVSRIVVTCSCGEQIELECQY